MILRRIADALRTQNWFTVIVEVLVVVIGIFLGLQVTEWNESRKERVEEREYLGRLHDDIQTQIEQMGYREDYFQVANDDIQIVRAYLTSPDATTSPPARLVAAFYNSTVIYPFKPFSITYEELINTGKIQILRNIKLRSYIAQYFYDTEPLLNAWNIENDNDYRNLIRSVVPSEIQNLAAQTCEHSVDGITFLKADCILDIDETLAANILADLRAKSSVLEFATLNQSKLNIALRLYGVNKIVAQQLLDELKRAAQ